MCSSHVCLRNISMFWAFRLLIGRDFTQEEDLPERAGCVVLSNGLWRTTFHADPHIVGRAILLKGAPYTVVGVLARGAQSPLSGETTRRVDLWTPLQPSRTGEGREQTMAFFCGLKPGSTWAQADAQLSRVRPDVSRS